MATKNSKAQPATNVAPITAARPGLIRKFATRFGVDDDKMLSTLKATAFKASTEVTNEQMMALLVVADQYNLNPFTKEIYAFPTDKGIVPIVGVDGWIRIINEHAQLEALEFDFAAEDSEDQWISCTIHRKDRSKPITVREYLAECRRDTGPWKSHPRRMLRHKALIQAGRIAFGFAGIYDPDEAERIRDANAIESTATPVSTKPATAAPQPVASAQAQLTHVPVDELRTRIDQIGIPENDFCAHFEIGAIEELPLNQVAAAMEYLSSVGGP